MITLEQGQPCFSDSQYVVIEGGEYAPTDLVKVGRVGHLDQVVAFYALFISTGEMP
jgi:hypothetical protein